MQAEPFPPSITKDNTRKAERHPVSSRRPDASHFGGNFEPRLTTNGPAISAARHPATASRLQEAES